MVDVVVVVVGFKIVRFYIIRDGWDRNPPLMPSNFPNSNGACVCVCVYVCMCVCAVHMLNVSWIDIQEIWIFVVSGSGRIKQSCLRARKSAKKKWICFPMTPIARGNANNFSLSLPLSPSSPPSPGLTHNNTIINTARRLLLIELLSLSTVPSNGIAYTERYYPISHQSALAHDLSCLTFRYYIVLEQALRLYYVILRIWTFSWLWSAALTKRKQQQSKIWSGWHLKV